MWIDSDFRVRFVSELKHGSADLAHNWLVSFEGSQLHLPKKFSPDTELLQRHAALCL